MASKAGSKRKVKSLPIVVIGGGPAGMTAARAAVQKYKNVVLYDKNPAPGKKLASIFPESIIAGEKMPPEKTARVFGEKREFILPALKAYGIRKIEENLKKLGISLSRNGDQKLEIPAGEFREFPMRLRDALESDGVVFKKSSRVSDIVIERGRVKGVVVNGATHPVSAAIIASGSFAGPKWGSTKDGYIMAEKAGHEIVPISAAMVGFETVEKYGHILAGVVIRNCRMEVNLDGVPEFSDTGNITFTEYGVEGDLILNNSARIIELLEKGAIRIHIDLAPDMTKSEIEKLLGGDFESGDRTTVWQILTRYVPDQMLDVMHRMIRVHCRKPAVTLSSLERKLLAIWMKDFNITVKRQRPFNETRGVLGGVSLADIDPGTMRSKKVGNLYFAGEVLDLLGPWGGYNMEMAFSTGYLAGLSAGKDNGAGRPK
jgi:predicted Rossmann fold flavoprotein